MKYLKKEMVRQVIELARTISPGPGKTNPTPEQKAFDAFLLEIGSKAVAELSALMWLGRDTHLGPEQWNDLVEQALGPRIREIYEVPKEKLGPFLRTGMERLARSRKTPKVATEEDRIILARGQNPEPSQPELSVEERRCLAAGRFLLDSFREQYGDQSLAKLGELLHQKGYLKSAEEKKLWTFT